MALPSARSPIRPGGKDEVVEDEWMRWRVKRVAIRKRIIRCVVKINKRIPRSAQIREIDVEEKECIIYRRTQHILFTVIKDHLDRERGNALPPHGLLFPISRQDFCVYHSTCRVTHTTTFGRGTLVVTRNSYMGPP